ncbi:hypothetical protein AB0D37_35105 [Streptomyces sp. NPDC048384]|uniref:hypothetical protein n=1 Tax=Streptomyces sp. NPDC048384 TaxID=3155487 RepID=UPI003434FC5C
MADGGTDPCVEGSGGADPVKVYGAALKAAVEPALAGGATQRQLAARAHVEAPTVSKYLNGHLVAPKKFVDVLPAFVAAATEGAVTLTDRQIEQLHLLRIDAQQGGEVGSKLADAREEIADLRRQLAALEAAYRANADQRVRDLEDRVARSRQRIRQLKRDLAAVQKDLEHERQRSTRAELAGSGLRIALVAVELARGARVPARDQDVIAQDEATARQLLAQASELQQRAEQLLTEMPGGASARPVLRERDGILFRHPVPVHIYTTASTLSVFVILHVNVASFVVTWRSDEGLTISQLIAYVVLVFPVALVLGGLLAASGLFVAFAHRETFGEAVLGLTGLTAAAALLLGISGPFFLPPVTWIGHAWAVDIGVL